MGIRNRFLIIGGLFFLPFFLTAQNRAIDSLKTVLTKYKADSSYVNTLDTLSYLLCRNGYYDSAISYVGKALTLANEINYKKGIGVSYCDFGQNYIGQCKYKDALGYFQKALSIAMEVQDKKTIANVYLDIGVIYEDQGDYAGALEYYFKALKIWGKSNYKILVSDCYNNIGIIYNEQHNYEEALKNYDLSLSIILILHDSLRLGDAYFAIGDVFLGKGQDSMALVNMKRAIKIGVKQKDKLLESYAFKEMGLILNRLGKYDSALYYFNESQKLKREMHDKQGEAVNLLNIAKIYINKKEFANSTKYLDSSLTLSRSIGDKKNIMLIYDAFTRLDSSTGNYVAVLGHYKMYNVYRDSLTNEESVRKIEGEKMRYENEKKMQADSVQLAVKQELQKVEQEKKDARQRIVRNVFIGGFGFALLFASVFFFQRKRIAKEKDVSDNLLLNILPSETAEELKSTGESKARNYELVTVMFTDFKNFTGHAENMTPEELVNEINYCYKEFDRIIARHNVEKIKTMGDGYMAAGGVPRGNITNPKDTVASALEIQNFMENMKTDREKQNKPYFEVRIGIHSGPVVAGIVGIKKFAYDIWGDTVNIAARMESSGEAGKVNISGATYELVKEKFNCTYRGKVLAKNKGEIDMYFVES